MTQDQMVRRREHRAAGQRRMMRLIVVLAVLLAIAVVIWLMTRGDDSSAESRAPEAVTPAGLSEVTDTSSVPVFWAGNQAEATLELSETEGGRTYVRYLTEGAQPGDPRADFLTIGSYEFANPIPALEKLSNQPEGVRRTVPGGGVAYFNRADPQNVYLAYPGIDVQIEVYDPDPVRAKELVTSGQIVPIN